ncbi:type I polyketide synthase [Adonisia turfae]|uniref:Acyltransferase domain-containing protein n=1 Tax=Adonisia turfae CCMR0081 TaxID=2292702 RepID=A0A6M0RH42_9CYAN|nr:type I polyketide synthase [Adonisia turfae]NEZ55587.1 acyltransferase domain-containing protein [Adonisia turfae CCMR0081]
MAVEQNGLEVAVIGLAGRFPGSRNIEAFWQNLVAGQEFVSIFSEDSSADSVKAAAILEDIDLFDASFFGINPRDAEIMDPQHRLFLECAWEALENAGYDPEQEMATIGVYAGVGRSTYLLYNLLPNHLHQTMGYFPILLASDKDYAPTRVSYKLNLNGPSISVGTACSSSLIAVNLAYQSLLSGECDMALAAGVSIKAPQNAMTLCPEGVSPDGHCWAFDARANGPVGGNGVGVVVLKRFSEALADGDYIYAVLKGMSANNDGAVKVSYTAPSELAQSRVIQSAQLMAEVEPETVTYVETHGSGTKLGDPIEIAALTHAFATEKKGYCALGSVKTNIGHLDAAAGITGLIKAVLCLDRKCIPPNVNFETPSPQIDFDNSPFFVNTTLSEWKTNGTPRRAGVSSFGFGGTNAHVVLEEAPQSALVDREQSTDEDSPWQLLLLSAKTEAALEQSTTNLIQYLQQHSQVDLADVAYTLQRGRQNFSHKRAVIARSVEDAIAALQDPKRILTTEQAIQKRPIAFMFTGLGSHYEDMAKELYHIEPIFAQQVDNCCQILDPLLGIDLREIIFPPQSAESTDTSAVISDAAAQAPKLDLRQMLGRDRQADGKDSSVLNQTHLTQPAIFVIEYALAKLWQSWEIHPSAMVGYSIGEYVAATLAGVLSLEEALTLVAKRAEMIAQLPPGAMLAVPLSAEAVQPLLNERISLSAVNGATQCVVAGEPDAIDQLQTQLIEQGLACRRLQSSHAFHSHMMEAIVPAFRTLVAGFNLQPPNIPYVSNLTGTWITPDQVTNPDYWIQHLRQPVRFADQVQALWQEQQPILLEIGAGQTLSSLALQCLDQVTTTEKIALASLRNAYESQSDKAFILNTVAQLWLAGVDIDWSAISAQHKRYRIPLPTYPFQRQHYWVDAPDESSIQSRLTTPEFWQSLVSIAQSKALDGVQTLDSHTHANYRQALDRLCIAYMNQAFRQLGAFQQPKQPYTLEALCAQTKVIPRYQELLARWLDVLVAHGCLQRDESGQFSQLEPLAPETISHRLADVKAKSADVISPEWIDDIYHIYGMNLPVILTGERQPLEFHFSMRLQEAGYTVPEYPSMPYYEPILVSIIQTIVDALPANNKLRILELGAGTGSATEKVLPLLSATQTDYTFTDVGSFFLSIAQQKFSQYSFINYGVLDVEKAPQEQGYAANSFDLLIAFNVLHVAQDIDATVKYARSLLAPGGILLLWEITEARLEADIMDGVLMQPIADATGQRNMGDPYLSKQQWKDILTVHGFDNVEAFSEFPAFGEHILVAQASALATPSAPPAFSQLKEIPAVSSGKQPVSDQKQPDMSDWFYTPSWQRSPLPSWTPQTSVGCWLVFMDDCELGEQIIQQLTPEEHGVVVVKIGEGFARDIDHDKQHTYTINPQRPGDYQTLFNELLALNLLPQKIIHLWLVNAENEHKVAETLGFYSLLFIAQALGEHNLKDTLEINVVSNNLQGLTGTEDICPEKALVLGPCQVIPTEYPHIQCRCIDLMLPTTKGYQRQQLVDRLLMEFNHPISSTPMIAYRGCHRWVKTFESMHLGTGNKKQSRLKKKGVYLITGGLGGVGLTLATYLAENFQAKLILTGRSSLPERDNWSDWLATHGQQESVSLKIRQIQHLESLGAEVMAVGADVTNLAQMQKVIEQACTQFGQIQGVIHAAFVRGGGIIQLKTQDVVAVDMAPKVKGIRVLEQLLKDNELDFWILCSSLRTLKPEAGLVDYSAENFFFDSFAHYGAYRYGWFIRSIDWDVWQGVGTAVTVQQEYEATAEKAFRIGMTPAEGVAIFERILSSSTEPQVIVSTQDFLADTGEQELVPLTPTNIETLKPKYQRPAGLKNVYVAPSSDLENKLTQKFQELLGFGQVGIHDSFFALGGDSLTGNILINQLRDIFQIEIPVRSLFECPTVSELTVLIENILIQELEALDEQEAEQLAAKED